MDGAGGAIEQAVFAAAVLGCAVGVIDAGAFLLCFGHFHGLADVVEGEYVFLIEHRQLSLIIISQFPLSVVYLKVNDRWDLSIIILDGWFIDSLEFIELASGGV